MISQYAPRWGTARWGEPEIVKVSDYKLHKLQKLQTMKYKLQCSNKFHCFIHQLESLSKTQKCSLFANMTNIVTID